MANQPQLPPRAGTRPRTSAELPHRQLDQQPSDSQYVDALYAEARTWPNVIAGPSAISVEGARALILDSNVTGGPPEAFVINREFCHVHTQGDLSLHASVPPSLAAAAERMGWAEPHYLVAAGLAHVTLVMIYAPRDQAEHDVVLGLIRASYEFALTGNADGAAEFTSTH